MITHPESDHFYGAFDIINNLQVETVALTGVLKDDARYTQFLELVHQKNINLLFLDSQKDFVIDEVFFDILTPYTSLKGKKFFDTINNSSISTRVSYGENSVLLTGDIEKKIEESLVESGIFLSSDILKAPHHGSKTSSSQSFIDAVSPDLVVFTAGKKNPFSHPSQEIIDRYNQKNIPFVSVKESTVHLVFDTEKFYLK